LIGAGFVGSPSASEEAAMSLQPLASNASVVSSSSERIVAAVERAAVRFVRTWGFSTLGMVAARFRIVEKVTAPREVLARRALASLPDIVWLDPAREWFTLVERDSALRAAIEKVVGVVGVVDRADLEQALGKRHAFGAAPPVVVRAYVEAIAARVARRSSPVELDPEEHVVLEAFEHAGGRASLADLRTGTRGRLVPGALARVLRESPLFVRVSRGTYRVVGSFPYRYVTLAGSTTIVAPIQ
jgi:hypothetical protein